MNTLLSQQATQGWSRAVRKAHPLRWNVVRDFPHAPLRVTPNLLGQSGITTYLHTNATGLGAAFYRVGMETNVHEAKPEKDKS